MDLKGRVALVTGGATGIGQATVLHLARFGVAGVVINYRTAKEQAELLAAEVRRIDAAGGRAFWTLDVLVNNAGVTPPGPVDHGPQAVMLGLDRASCAAFARSPASGAKLMKARR